MCSVYLVADPTRNERRVRVFFYTLDEGVRHDDTGLFFFLFFAAAAGLCAQALIMIFLRLRVTLPFGKNEISL